ncbi:MAG TPA: glucose-6-phosphate dehydrogenase assembly protein OpcA [Gaiellaceae bacterium]|nr:glucose-6-phosphate dehydrogenase assembly protein OpcA [Gaiellaceae bacterium]
MADAALVEEWSGQGVTLGDVERELARLRADSVDDRHNPHQRTSVMTHVAWVPPPWLDVAERTLAGLAERHPSRTVLLVPRPDEPESRIDADVSVRCFAVGDGSVCGEVIELHLLGDRAHAPASIVLPLAISDLPVFLRWRGEPEFGGTQWQQLVGVADRVVVDSSEWDELRYPQLAESFDRTVVSDIAWSRLYDWRVELAGYWPALRDQEIRIAGPRAEASLLRGWLASRLGRAVRAIEPAGDLSVRLGNEELRAPHAPPASPSDLLSAELDRFARDRVYEAAARAAA